MYYVFLAFFFEYIQKKVLAGAEKYKEEVPRDKG